MTDDTTARLRRLVVALLLTGLVAGCSGDDEQAGAGSTESTLEHEPATTTTTTPEDTALGEVLLEEVPLPEFRRADEEVGAGAMGIDDAIELNPDRDAERALLEEQGFERAHSRVWTNPTQDVVYLNAFEFADAEGAAAYAEAAADRLREGATATFEVPEVEGATGATVTEEDPAGGTTAVHSVAFARGDRWFYLTLFAAEDRLTPETARELAAAQAERAEQVAAGG